MFGVVYGEISIKHLKTFFFFVISYEENAVNVKPPKAILKLYEQNK